MDGESTCAGCGLRYSCPRCGERYEDPVSQRFCADCGLEVLQPSWSEHSSSASTPHDAPAPGPSAPAFEPLFGDPSEQAPQPVSSGARLTRKSLRSLARAYRRVTKTVGKLYLELGEALLEAGRLEEAVEAYRHALEEDADQAAWHTTVYASLAEATIRIAEVDKSLRSDALRAALEATLRAQETLTRTAKRVLELAGPDFLDAHGAWVCETWRTAIGELTLDEHQQTYSGLLVARSALYAGASRRALEGLQATRSAAPALLTSIGPGLLREPLVPAAIAAAGLADTHWVLAQALDLVRDDVRALEHLNAALAAGFEPGGETELLALELRAELLSRRGDNAGATACHVDLGRALLERGRPTDAIDAFRTAARKDSAAAEPWWHLANALRITAQLDAAPFIDLSAVRRASEALEQGLARRLPARRQEAWAYCVLALLSEDVAWFDPQPTEGRWKALLASERALAVDAASADAWALVSHCCRLLGLYGSAIAARDRAVQLDQANAMVAIEALILDSEVARPDEALAVAERYRSALSGYEGSFEAVVGYVTVLAAREREALRLLEAAVNRQDRPFPRLFRGIATLLTDGMEAARDDLSWVADSMAAAPEALGERALALALLGDLELAGEAFRRLAVRTGQDSLLGSVGLVWCQVLTDGPESAVADLVAALGPPLRGPSLAPAALMLRLLAHQAENPRLRATIEESFRELDDLSEHRLAPDASPAGVAAELRDAVNGIPSGSAAWVATHACLGRQAMEEGAWNRALDVYDRIEASGAMAIFPELRTLQTRCLNAMSADAEELGDVETAVAAQARLAAVGDVAPWEQGVAIARAERAAGRQGEAIRRLVAVLEADGAVATPRASRTVGDQLLALDQTGTAKRALLAGLSLSEHDTVERGRVELRLGVVAALEDDVLNARQWLVNAVCSVAAEKGVEQVSLVVKEAEELVDEAGRRRLDTAMRFLLDDPRLASVQRVELAAARFKNSRDRCEGCPRVRPVAPVVLGLDERLLLDGVRSPLGERLTEEALPSLRDRLRHRAGIRLPGVQVYAHERSSDDPDWELMVREAPVDSGRLPRNRAADADVELVAALQSRLEHVLRQYLADFVGLSEVGLELDDWAAGGAAGERLAQLERGVPDRRARVDVARMVHRLVSEQVPVEDVETLVAAYAETCAEGLDSIAAIEHVRLALARRLDVERFDRRVVFLDPADEDEIEQHLRSAGATRMLAMPPKAAADIIARIERRLAGIEPSEAAVAVERDSLRPFTQRLVESRWRSIAVVSRGELELLAPSRFPHPVASAAT